MVLYNIQFGAKQGFKDQNNFNEYLLNYADIFQLRQIFFPGNEKMFIMY